MKGFHTIPPNELVGSVILEAISRYELFAAPTYALGKNNMYADQELSVNISASLEDGDPVYRLIDKIVSTANNESGTKKLREIMRKMNLPQEAADEFEAIAQKKIKEHAELAATFIKAIVDSGQTPKEVGWSASVIALSAEDIVIIPTFLIHQKIFDSNKSIIKSYISPNITEIFHGVHSRDPDLIEEAHIVVEELKPDKSAICKIEPNLWAMLSLWPHMRIGQEWGKWKKTEVIHSIVAFWA
jgi:hypothetical protein